jgi:hypothetical protein
MVEAIPFFPKAVVSVTASALSLTFVGIVFGAVKLIEVMAK